MRSPPCDGSARHAFVPALVAASVLLAALAGCSKPEPTREPVRAVRTMTVAEESAGNALEFAGEVKARTEARLGFRVGGKIVRRNVEIGQTVKPGQVLAQIDAQDLRLGQDSARAALLAAQTNVDLAGGDFRRYKDLHAQGFIGAAELERRDSALKSAQATLDQALAQSRVQGNQAGYANLLADAAGIVTGVDAEAGSVVAAGTPVLRVALAGPRDVVFAVPEDRVALIRTMAAQRGRFSVRLWGADAAPLPAAIREISAAADPVTRTFLVKADIGNTAANGVQLGQTATVVLDPPKVAGATKLPLSALKQEQGRTVVWVVDKASMTVQPQPVQLAGAEGNQAVVTGGLQRGQLVVTAGAHVLSPGQKVKLYVGRDAAVASDAPHATPVSVK